VSSLSIGVILGSSLADYINSEGQALAQTFDGGALVTTLEAPNCATGGPGTVKASDFPTPAQAESTNGNQTVTMTAYDTLNTAVAGLGVETATATTEPSGTATNTISSETLADIATISGATATSTAEVQNGNTRYASATADISSVSLAKGLIVLKGLHWVATQTSGASNTSTASFDIGGLTVAGANVPISTDSITTVLAIINTALSPIGFQIDWPAVTTLPDGTINISALKIGLDDSALGQELIGSNLYKAQTVRNVLQQELFDINCNTASAFTVSDVGVGILAGAGDLDVLLGGAHALTNDQGEASPFGSGSLPSSGLSLGDTTLTTSPTSTFVPGTPAVPATTGSTSTSGSGGSSSQKVALGAVEKTSSCQSLGSAGGGCSSRNWALPVGLIGLGLLGGLVAWDYIRQRRRRRLSGPEGL
jgi:hypothetical protein